jgi:hypothetical protein
MEDSLKHNKSLVRTLENGLMGVLIICFHNDNPRALSQGVILPPPIHARDVLGWMPEALILLHRRCRIV